MNRSPTATTSGCVAPLDSDSFVGCVQDRPPSSDIAASRAVDPFSPRSSQTIATSFPFPAISACRARSVPRRVGSLHVAPLSRERKVYKPTRPGAPVQTTAWESFSVCTDSAYQSAADVWTAVECPVEVTNMSALRPFAATITRYCERHVARLAIAIENGKRAGSHGNGLVPTAFAGVCRNRFGRRPPPCGVMGNRAAQALRTVAAVEPECGECFPRVRSELEKFMSKLIRLDVRWVRTGRPGLPAVTRDGGRQRPGAPGRSAGLRPEHQDRVANCSDLRIHATAVIDDVSTVRSIVRIALQVDAPSMDRWWVSSLPDGVSVSSNRSTVPACANTSIATTPGLFTAVAFACEPFPWGSSASTAAHVAMNTATPAPKDRKPVLADLLTVDSRSYALVRREFYFIAGSRGIRKFVQVPSRPTMRDVLISLVHLIVTIIRVMRPGDVRPSVAESVLLTHRLLVVTRPRKRATDLRPADRFIAALCAGPMRPARILRSAISRQFSACR